MKKLIWLVLLFSLPVQAVVLRWDAVTTGVDGSAQTPDGYKVYCGSQTFNSLTTSLTLPTLADGTYACHATALKGTTESGPSNVVTVVCANGCVAGNTPLPPACVAPVPVPPTIAYVVQVNGTRPDRPTYDIAAWKTSTTMVSVGRALVGSPCGDELIRKTTVEYRPVGPNQMAACVVK